MAFSYLPVYTPDNQLLYHAPIGSVDHLIKSGHVRERGSKRRTRALIAICGCEHLVSLLLALPRAKAGTKFIHRGETATNPPGVWTFSRVEYG